MNLFNALNTQDYSLLSDMLNDPDESFLTDNSDLGEETTEESFMFDKD